MCFIYLKELQKREAGPLACQKPGAWSAHSAEAQGLEPYSTACPGGGLDLQKGSQHSHVDVSVVGSRLTCYTTVLGPHHDVAELPLGFSTVILFVNENIYLFLPSLCTLCFLLSYCINGTSSTVLKKNVWTLFLARNLIKPSVFIVLLVVLLFNLFMFLNWKAD